MEEGKGKKRKEALTQNHSANRVTQLSPFFASIFPLSPPQKRLLLRLTSYLPHKCTWTFFLNIFYTFQKLYYKISRASHTARDEWRTAPVSPMRSLAPKERKNLLWRLLQKLFS